MLGTILGTVAKWPSKSLGITWHYFRVTRHYSALLGIAWHYCRVTWQLLPSHLALVPSHSALLGTGKIGFSGTLLSWVPRSTRQGQSFTVASKHDLWRHVMSLLIWCWFVRPSDKIFALWYFKERPLVVCLLVPLHYSALRPLLGDSFLVLGSMLAKLTCTVP
jgi:hypothetical protein